jgi:membrane-associated phospholipid phosphatase
MISSDSLLASMKSFLIQYLRFVQALISWRFLPLYLLAIVSTYTLVQSGLDWQYIVWVYQHDLNTALYTADIIGFLVALFLPLTLYVMAHFFKRAIYQTYTLATSYCVLLGFTVSTFIKMFTGRTSPPHYHHGEELVLIDNSHAFNFGFMREQIIGGWPSSHTTIMIALATCLWIMLPIRWWYKLPIAGVTLFVGIGVTFGFHWLSEFVAGALLGIAVGTVVGTYYRSKYIPLFKTSF